jgi:2Fe-2S ferredoxin
VVAVTFIQPDGEAKTIDILAGTTLRDGAVNAMVEGIVGMCGGNMSCATCHCYVDDTWYSRLPEIADEERDVLDDLAIDVRPNSRLGCQIRIEPALDGLIVSVPEEQP